MKTTSKIILNLIMGLFIIISNSSANNETLKIKVKGKNMSDETVIRFKNGATAGFDSNLDAYKMFGFNQYAPVIYTKAMDKYNMSINSLPELKSDVSVGVCLGLNFPADYKLFFTGVSDFTQKGISLYFQDNFSNLKVKIQSDTDFVVPIVGNDPNNYRFNIIYSLPTIVDLKNVSCNGKADGRIIIADKGNTNYSYNVINSNGAIVYAKSNVYEKDTVKNLFAGNYTIEQLFASGFVESYSVSITEPAPVKAVFIPNTNIYYMSNNTGINFTNYSEGANSYIWKQSNVNFSTEFEPVFHPENGGDYEITLIAKNGQCSDTTKKMINVINDLPLSNNYDMQNTKSKLVYAYGNEIYFIYDKSPYHAEMYDISGRIVWDGRINNAQNISVNQSAMYLIKITMNNNTWTEKIVAGN